MKSFRKYIAENDYPGAYYTQDMNRMIAHFNNKEEKAEFDADPRNDPNDEYIYRSDARVDANKLLKGASATIANIAKPIATTGLKTALGNGVLSQIPIEQIENNVNKLNEELRKIEQRMEELRKIYRQTEDSETKKKIEDSYEQAYERRSEIVDAKKKYEERNYN